MHSWFKTCGAPGSSLVVRLIHGSATVIVTIILLASNALPQSESDRVGMSANELARKVVTNELKFQYDDHGHWMYRLEKRNPGGNRSRKSSRQTMVLLVDPSPLMAIRLTPNSSRRRTNVCRGS